MNDIVLAYSLRHQAVNQIFHSRYARYRPMLTAVKWRNNYFRHRVPWALLLCLLLGNGGAAIAQSSSPDAVQKAIRDELEDSNLLDDRIEEEVSQTFGWTLELLNVLITVLIAIPILTGLAAIYLRQSIIDRLVREIKQQLQEEIKKEVDKQLQTQVAQQLNQRVATLQEEIEASHDNIMNLSRSVELFAQQAKERIVSEIGTLTTPIVLAPAANVQSFVQPEQPTSVPPIIQEEFASPQIQQRIHTLTQQLESIESEYPQLLTANDYVNQGDAFYYDRRPEEALEAYETAIAKDPALFSAWLGKSKALRRLCRLEEAIAANEKVIELSPTNHRGWFGKAYALQDLHRYEEALAPIERAIELSPDTHYLWKHRGYLLTKLSRFLDAKPCFERALALNPRSSGTFYTQAYFYAAQHQIEDAIACLNQASALYPQFRTVVKTDSDFAELRTEPQFQAWMGSAPLRN